MTVTHEQRVEAAQLALQTLDKLGHPKLKDSIVIEWSKRLETSLGQALYGAPKWKASRSQERYRINGYITRIRFSEKLWPRASETTRRETVIHEVAHIVTDHEHYRVHNTRSRDSHGPAWRAVMRRAGVEPTRCHDVKVGQTPRRSVPAHCSCQTHWITRKRAARLLRGAVSICRKCRKPLVLGSLEHSNSSF